MPTPLIGLRPVRDDRQRLGALVLWTSAFNRHLGRHIAGVAKESGGIEWLFGRKRGLEI
jgi:hypothetical protein